MTWSFGTSEFMPLTFKLREKHLAMFDVVDATGARLGLVNVNSPLAERIACAVNNHDALVAMLQKIIEIDKEFMDGMGPDYDGDPLSDACAEAQVLLANIQE